MSATASDIPADLRAAFDAYERAILANDLDALDAAFAPGSDTLRGDGAGLLVGHDAISAFRGTRGGVSPRVIDSIEYRSLGDDLALLVSVSRFVAGGRGPQERVGGVHAPPVAAWAQSVAYKQLKRPTM